MPDYIEKEKSSMEKVNFGVTKRGEEASLYVLENKNNTTIKVTDYGATLVSLLPVTLGRLSDETEIVSKTAGLRSMEKSTGLTRMRIIIISTVEKTGLTRSSGK